MHLKHRINNNTEEHKGRDKPRFFAYLILHRAGSGGRKGSSPPQIAPLSIFHSRLLFISTFDDVISFLKQLVQRISC